MQSEVGRSDPAHDGSGHGGPPWIGMRPGMVAGTESANSHACLAVAGRLAGKSWNRESRCALNRVETDGKRGRIMAARRDSDALRWLDPTGREGACALMSDGRLIEHFLARPGATSEAAFEALVRRHGPLVLSLCRGVLRNDQDAADAFQATFLVLTRRASKIRDPDRLAAWLGRVARRIALRSRAEAAWRAAVERRTPAHDPEAATAPVDFVALETASLVRSEVDRLPETDRLLLQLTYWQGKTYEEAAACSPGRSGRCAAACPASGNGSAAA
jgi:RNA polymerase sigma factor (sigma-70 family)